MKTIWNSSHRWHRPNEFGSFRAWLFCLWCDYEQRTFWQRPDGIRVFGFEWEGK